MSLQVLKARDSERHVPATSFHATMDAAKWRYLCESAEEPDRIGVFCEAVEGQYHYLVPMESPKLFPRADWEEYKQKYNRFEILDEVFTEFLQTNVEGLRRLEDLRVNTVKTFTNYRHHNIPYLATIRSSRYNGSDTVSIRLCNNGGCS